MGFRKLLGLEAFSGFGLFLGVTFGLTGSGLGV